MPIRAGWLRAVARGHAAVAQGLAIQSPVFMACSTRSWLRAGGYSERARRSDIVLDVQNIAARAHHLGPRVTLVRVEDGFHDLTLSLPSVRASLFAELASWLPYALDRAGAPA